MKVYCVMKADAYGKSQEESEDGFVRAAAVKLYVEEFEVDQ